MIDVLVSEKPVEQGPRQRLRALYHWITGAPASDDAALITDRPSERDAALERIGHYAITHKLGSGAMGVVYAARDERLGRTVALKKMSSVAGDETARKRFWREARAAASVNHPHVCQIYEIGEDRGELFIAMELLEGEALADRLKQGAMAVSQAMPIALEILAALAALHSRGIVHRDLKPSNVFLTPHGVKLLDFGLARPEPEETLSPDADLTRPGFVMGTPRYMAPEQILGEPVDARGDLFATGAILFEMLAGRPAFTGKTVGEVLHATISEQPPALSGSPSVAAVDRVIRRALAKKPAERPVSADAMADELRGVRSADSDGTRALAQALTRIVVLPFRVLRPDTETDFLAFSLADAIATSLSASGSLIVRSSATAARFSADAPDLKALAVEADVDRVVMGTLLRSGDQLRATAQLVEAPSGTLLTSETVQASLGDLFGLQDDIARRVVQALSLPLTGAPVSADAPHNARAYELYLRANELARTYDGMAAARELYLRALDLDSSFAPAWARLGRCYRVIGKYVSNSPDSETRAEEAFQRALALNPHLSIAHKFYANLEADIGEPVRAMVRLLNEANRHGNDPELFAGLVHACRYCGLFDESMAAHAEARRLDPNVPTSLEQTLLMAGELDVLLGMEPAALVAGADEGIRVIGLGLSGRRDEARTALVRMRRAHISAFQSWSEFLMAWLDKRTDDMQRRMSMFDGLTIREDPEAIFQEGRFFCDVGESRQGLELVKRAVAKGYWVVGTLERSQEFGALRGDPEFEAVIAEAAAGRDRASAAFREAGGERLLGRRAAS